MKRIHTVHERSGSSIRLFLPLVLSALFAIPQNGCDFAGPSDPGVGIPNVTQAAPHLDEYDATGQYRPYFITGDMGRPRYFHNSALSQGGLGIAIGGSDERGYSGIDTVELFDQSTWAKDAPRPQSLAGLWIDTTFEGDPLVLENGPRMLFTVSPIGGKFLIIGGSADLLGGPIVEKAELFDPDLRTFESLEAEMVNARFRHATTKLNDGSLLIVGGQIQSTVTIINDQIAEGFPGRQQQVTVFITTADSELYVPTENEFRLLTIPGQERASKLNTPRGRAGHDVRRFAGPDETLNSSDDIWLVAGGFQALSAQFAPRTKLPGSVARVNADGITVLEFFDPLTRAFTQVGNLELAAPRINDPHIMNMGLYNDYTIDGVKGLGNVLLITHGNVDAACPVTPVVDELLVANYTGFGPAQGLQFFLVDEPASHAQDYEYVASPPAVAAVGVIGRCATNPLHMPRRIATVPGVSNLQTWVIALGGVYIYDAGACVYEYSASNPAVGAGCLFDPFYNLLAEQLGLSTRGLQSTRSPTNPTGVIGCWLTLDGQLPTTSLENYGTTAPARWARPSGGYRVWYRNIQLPGEDGIINTPDDRILLAGGGKEYGAPGGEPTTPSAEIFLQPGVNSTVPSP